jgi:hypothetical protein
MTDDLYRAVGEANGKLDTLTNLVRDYIEAHDKRHERVEEQLASHAADINKAKGAKTAVLILAGGLASVVSIAVAAASKLFGG